jgi:hypothetical protein
LTRARGGVRGSERRLGNPTPDSLRFVTLTPALSLEERENDE